MPTSSTTFTRTLAAATLIGGLAFAGSAFAAGSDAGSSSMQMGSSPVSGAASAGKKMPTAEEMSQKVETRISNLHEKLKITPEQESAWNDVAQAMRESEAGVMQAVQERHAEAKNMNAVQDLQSYQKIAQAHADGLQKVISTFSSLYDDMSPEQKKNADDVFGRFEGHRGLAKASAHGKKAGSAGSSAE